MTVVTVAASITVTTTDGAKTLSTATLKIQPKPQECREIVVYLHANACESGLRLSNSNKSDCIRLAPSLQP